jgi:hypothetical protein
MANFPLATWEVTLPSFFATLGAGSPTLIDPGAAGVAYGFELFDDSTGEAGVDSIAGRLRDALVGAFGGTVTAAYNYVSSTVPATSPLTYTLGTSYGSALTLSFGSGEVAVVYGFNAATIVIGSGSQSTTTQFNVDGVWCPCGVSGDLRRATVQRAAASSSEMSGLSTDVVNWGQVANLEFISSIFPAANLTRWYAKIDPFYTAAQRDKNDPNNTLEGLLEAAATGVNFRLYRSPSDKPPGTTPDTPNAARMPVIADNSAVSAYVQADDEPRLWSTTGLFFRGNT